MWAAALLVVLPSSSGVRALCRDCSRRLILADSFKLAGVACGRSRLRAAPPVALQVCRRRLFAADIDICDLAFRCSACALGCSCYACHIGLTFCRFRGCLWLLFFGRGFRRFWSVLRPLRALLRYCRPCGAVLVLSLRIVVFFNYFFKSFKVCYIA